MRCVILRRLQPLRLHSVGTALLGKTAVTGFELKIWSSISDRHIPVLIFFFYQHCGSHFRCVIERHHQPLRLPSVGTAVLRVVSYAGANVSVDVGVYWGEVISPVTAARTNLLYGLIHDTVNPSDCEASTIFFQLCTAAFKAYCAIWVRRSNFRHQASPRVTPRDSTQRRKVELWTRNVW